MKLLFVTNARIPTEKAHGLQIIKMCEAFQRQGLEVELFVPTRGQSPEMQDIDNLWQYYDVDTRFTVRYILTPDFIKLQKMLPHIVISCLHHFQSFVFSLFALFVTLRERDSMYYSRSLHTILVFYFTKWLHRKKVYFEAHELHGDPREKGIMRRVGSCRISRAVRQLDGIVVITQRLQTLYRDLGVHERAILVAPDGVEAKRLSLTGDRTEARQRLHLPLEPTIICYTGHLFRWKGVYALAESSRYLPEGYLMYIVGGKQCDLQPLQQFVVDQRLHNVVLTGHVPYRDVPHYLTAADVLVLPNSATANISREYTSPLKLFEYMAAQRPIVASDLPSLREILRHRENAYLVAPDNPTALAEGIETVIHNHTLSQAMIETAYTDVQKYTWDIRAQRVIQFFCVSK